MDKKYIFLVFVVIIAIVAIASYALINTNFDDNKTTNITKNSSDKSPGGDNITKNKTARGISVIQEGPSSADYGKNVSIKWTVTNKGSQPITNVNGTSQDFNYNFGTIKPGESKSITFKMSIPSLDQVKNDFGDDATVPNPFIIGGFHLSYNLNGKLNEVTSNSLSIPL